MSTAARAALASAVLVSSLMSFGGCGAATGGSVVRGPGADIALGPVPSTWRSIDVSDALVAYRDDSDDATVAVNARCGKDAEDVPLEALRAHLFIHFTERETQQEDRIVLDGREALRSVLHAKLDGVQKAFVVFVLKKDGCVYDFLYIARPESLDAGRPAFERFVGGFRTIDR